MPKRELSPESKSRRERPLQQQKSISDIIGPMVAGVNLDQMPDQMTSNDTLDSLAADNATRTAAKGSTLGSNGSSRQNSSEGESMENIIQEESCVAEMMDPLDADFTDVDGRLGDAMKFAGKAGKKVVKKAAHKVAKQVETVVHESMQVAFDAAENIEDVVEGVTDIVAEASNAAIGLADLAGARVLSRQLSLEERPSNNVYISHPEDGVTSPISMGMNIRYHQFKNGSGQLVLMIEPGKLADQAKLKEGDVIIAVGDKDVTQLPVNEAIHIFGYIDSTFSITVIRMEAADDCNKDTADDCMKTDGEVDIPILVKKTITINVHLNDNVVAIKVLDIKCTSLFYNTQSEVLFQHKFGSTGDPYFMQVHNNSLRMISTSNDECCFYLNRYSDILNNCTPCAIQHKISDQALGVQIDEHNNTHTVALTDTDNLMGNAIGADLRFFHLHTSGGDILLESSLQNEYFLAVDENSTEPIDGGHRTRRVVLCHRPYSNTPDFDNFEYKFRFMQTDPGN